MKAIKIKKPTAADQYVSVEVNLEDKELRRRLDSSGRGVELVRFSFTGKGKRHSVFVDLQAYYDQDKPNLRVSSVTARRDVKHLYKIKPWVEIAR